MLEQIHKKMKYLYLIPVFLTFVTSVWAQGIIVNGKVTGETGEALPGVTVLLKGTTTGTATDASGNYVFNVPNANGTLVVSFIGFQTQEVPINNRTTINISLATDAKALSEVVVVGYGTQRKADITGSISSVSTKDFENQPVTRPDQILQGRASGVQVTSAAGAPGGDVRIRIRGTNSLIGDNEPLYVVDGFVGADFNTINPNDIASMEVLKDAASTAIYGSRGANGVVIITTKTGKKGSMQVDFMTRISASELIERYNTMNAADFAETVNARAQALTPAGGTYTPRFTDAEIQNFRQNGGTDWQNEIFRTALGQEYQLGFSGGSEKTSYLVNGNYLKQEGIIENSDYKRYSIRSNITTQISNKFSTRLNFTGTRRENHNTSGTSQRSGSLAQALAWAPTTPVRDASGQYIIKDPVSSIFSNPVAINNETDNRNERTNLNLIGGLNYSFIPELSLDIQYGINYGNNQYKDFAGPAITTNNPSASRNSTEDVMLQNTNNLTYKNVFNQNHSLEVTGVVEAQKFMATGFGVNVSGLTYPSQSYNNLALSLSSQVNSGYQEWALFSLLGRINYAFKERYLFSAAVRRDGSSKFQGDNKYSVFPSVSAGWRLSEEGFMQNLPLFSNFKLRGSWGLTGNQGISPYRTLSTYVTNLDDAGAVFNGNGGTIISGINLGNPGNPELKWETTEQLNLGADIEILSGRVSFSADYFVKNTRDLLQDQPLPGYLGGYAILVNIGDMQNKGWEFSLGGVPVNRGDFSWNSSVNVSMVKNKLVSLGGGVTEKRLNQFILRPGEPMGTFYGYNYLGTWKPDQADEAARYNLKPGDARYEDVDNDGVYNDKDWQIIGHALPKTSLGWNNTFNYKALSLNIFFQGLYGMDKLNYSYAYGMLGSTDAKEVIFEDIKNRYIPGVNETSDIPAFSSAPSNSFTQSSRFIESAGFLRLKNLSLSYGLPKTSMRNIAGIRVFASATNLLTFTKYKGIDPEANSNSVSGVGWEGYGADAQQGIDFGAYPNSKVYTVGLNLSF